MLHSYTCWIHTLIKPKLNYQPHSQQHSHIKQQANNWAPWKACQISTCYAHHTYNVILQSSKNCGGSQLHSVLHRTTDQLYSHCIYTPFKCCLWGTVICYGVCNAIHAWVPGERSSACTAIKNSVTFFITCIVIWVSIQKKN